LAQPEPRFRSDALAGRQAGDTAGKGTGSSADCRTGKRVFVLVVGNRGTGKGTGDGTPGLRVKHCRLTRVGRTGGKGTCSEQG
jgi:hypothetical protein